MSDTPQPGLSRGARLIDNLVQAVISACKPDATPRHLATMATSRTTLEHHMKAIEYKAGMTPKFKKRPGRKGKGYSVTFMKTNGPNKHRLMLTTAAKGGVSYVGLFASRTEAEEEGKRRVAELGGTA